MCGRRSQNDCDNADEIDNYNQDAAKSTAGLSFQTSLLLISVVSYTDCK